MTTELGLGEGPARVVEDGDNVLILKAIKRAAVAGGLEYWGRIDPKSARGLQRCAEHHRAVYETALTEFMEGTGLLQHAVRPVPVLWDMDVRAADGEPGASAPATKAQR